MASALIHHFVSARISLELNVATATLGCYPVQRRIQPGFECFLYRMRLGYCRGMTQCVSMLVALRGSAFLRCQVPPVKLSTARRCMSSLALNLPLPRWVDRYCFLEVLPVHWGDGVNIIQKRCDSRAS
jgi:hypothetical protein